MSSKRYLTYTVFIIPVSTKRHRSLLQGKFNRVICDEGHAVKTIRTKVHQSVATLRATYKWFLSATPMPNRVIDICGYLSLFHVPGFDTTPRHPDDYDESDSQNDPLYDYRFYSQKNPFPSPPPFYLLSPRRLAVVARQGSLTATAGFWILPVVLRLLCIQRRFGDAVSMDSKGKNHIIIGDDIPPGRIMTIDLKLPTKTQSRHDLTYSALIPLLKKADKSSEGTENIKEVAGKID
ncbi:hypothetical protein BDV24DRAFT_159100 [Aspergillus arachidicola]|uniref:SNF2 N-terminal domain-containing protein n=1 Tax=Aspergillus arachidicola TaxID=656916 RepID=A0A5N6YMD4_9EURO|nr:hypothetical protein BDV24DRAFT_159100 [Aspergillus arachidicola]